ncbi:unnamed protein product [Medioppia subpectinata]|uniref:non-specific serine/threonine protein kinase n=1 Tax=Medioppia subpectinata TaxID=1979941 RepID=A0A7R9LNA2_9ACAR|nr:unnamed protein product [Medioppia subpectinata]CAG2119973.1 unnamed protein product [Medioppia subpectinata]
MADKKLEDTISIGDADNYELIRRLGSGRYGEVFEAKHVANNKRYAIKVLKPVRPEKVLREVDVLRRLQSGPNIITLKDVIVNDGTPALVFPFVSNETLKTVAMDLTEQEIPLYLYKLLRAIDFCHKNEVIHRDIKPSNVMIDRSMKTLRLIDWGLADTYTDGRIYPVTVASRFYKPPELLLGFSKYDYSLDMWSFGCVAAGLLFKREPFFNGLDNSDQLKKIVCVLGTDCLKEYVQKYRLPNLKGIKYLLDSDLQRRQWEDFLIHGLTRLSTPISIDFIDKLLVFDHKFRLTADEALRHPFFASLRSNKIV